MMLFFLHLSFDFYLRLFRSQHGLNLGIQSVLDSIGNADLTAQSGEDGFASSESIPQFVGAYEQALKNQMQMQCI